MSRVISCRDLLLAEELSHIKNQIELIHPKNDDLVKSILNEIGFDTRHVFEYLASNHRDMQGNTGIGFICIGDINRDKRFKQFLDTHLRIVAAGIGDISLGKEMASLQGRSYNYNKNENEDSGKKRKKPSTDDFTDEDLLEMGYTTGDESDEYVEPDYEENLAELKQLENLKNLIRSVNLHKGN